MDQEDTQINAAARTRIMGQHEQRKSNGHCGGWVKYICLLLLLASFQGAIIRVLSPGMMEIGATHRRATTIMIDPVQRIKPDKQDMRKSDAAAIAIGTTSVSSSISSKYERIIAELESVSLRYYIYDDANITMPRITENLKNLGRVSPGTLNMLDALERHPLRTLDPNQADFFIVPIHFYSLHANHRRKLPQAMDALLESSIFNATQGRRHIYFSIGGRMFSYTGSSGLLIRNTIKYHEAIAHGLVVKDVDMVECQKMASDNQTHGDWKRLFKTWIPISPSTFSVGFMPGKEDGPPLIHPSYDKFASSNWTFFYHTRVQASVYNSTIYRRAPLTIGNTTTSQQDDDNNFDDMLNTSSIGFDISAQEWKLRFSHSKFCLVIRGDDPGSRAFLRSLRVGCIPVVASDYLERFSATLKASLNNFSDFAIFVDEQAFVNNPGLEMCKVMQEYSNKEKVLEKIEGAAFAQRIVFPDHPQSLFVPAFLKQAMLTLPAEDQTALQRKQKSKQ